VSSTDLLIVCMVGPWFAFMLGLMVMPSEAARDDGADADDWSAQRSEEPYRRPPLTLVDAPLHKLAEDGLPIWEDGEWHFNGDWLTRSSRR
jgi:hypothetical protein